MIRGDPLLGTMLVVSIRCFARPSPSFHFDSFLDLSLSSLDYARAYGCLPAVL